MIGPFWTRDDDGNLVLRFLPRHFDELLLEIPDLLAEDPPDAVRERLFPTLSDDEETNREWVKLVHPELYSLLASAREIVSRDLESLRRPGSLSRSLEIPQPHRHAWISALNAARLALAAANGIEEDDMDHERPLDFENERDRAVVKIHLLAEIQAMLIHEELPPPEDVQDDGFDSPAAP